MISIAIEDAAPLATEYFTKICGFNKESEKIRRMLSEGMEIKEEIKDRISIRAVVSSFGKGALSGNVAEVNGVSFVCNAFEQINPGSVQTLYAYLLTAGIYELPDETPIIRQLYADIWGTAFVDAGLEILKARLSGGFAFEAFGPGFYGMDIDQIGKFFDLLASEKIGVNVRNSSLMLPLKSCAGFLVVVDDESKLPDSDCKSCRADHKGCEFCHAVIKRKKSGAARDTALQ